MSKFSRAIVRAVPRTLEGGITTAQLGKPDYDLACEQHARYVAALRELGLQVEVLEADDRFPDSVFVEDPAVVTERCALITRPGAATRRGEATAVAAALEPLYGKLERIEEPGTLEGGDVLQIGERFFVGVSARTNRAGAEQLARILANYDYHAELVPLRHFLHLKTGVSHVGGGKLLLAGELADCPQFAACDRWLVPHEETYCANAIQVNGTVMLPLGYPRTRRHIEETGRPVVELAMSEFQKVDGGLSCLSLRIP